MEFVLLALVIITIFGIGRIVCRELKKKTDILASGKEGEVFPIPVKEGIQAILNDGGIPVLAHPCQYDC